MKNSSKNTFIEDLLSTILEIIEDKPLYTIPIAVYCILIEIYHHQNAGYFLSTFEMKPLNDEKMAYVAHINEVSPGTFLCFFKANNVITLIVFALFNLIMYFYYSYLFILTYAKRHHQQFLEANKKTFTSINRALNSFFTLFWWIFFTPFIEINSGVLVTGANSFLTWSREGMGDTSYANKPKILIFLGCIGLLLSVLTCLIIIFFFRNYEFHETNLLKRRFNTLLIGLAFTRFFLVFFYYLNFPIVAKLKHLIAQIIGVFTIYDHMMYMPFKNKTVSSFYGVSAWFFEVAVIISNLWILTDYLPPVEHFYIFLILGGVGGGLILQAQFLQTDVLMKIETGNFNTYYRKFDYFLEELMRLAQNSSKDESEKYSILQFLAFHRQHCDDAECICQETNFVDYKNDIDIEKISLFIIKKFNWALCNHCVQSDSDEFEHLSLKYISFLAKYKNNPPRAYNELKSLSSKRKSISIYFRTLSNILSKSIEFIMKQVYVRVESERNQQMRLNEELDIKEILIVDEFKNEMIYLLKDYCQKKIDFWQKLRQGFPNFEQLKKYTSSISQFGINISEKYKAGIQTINHAQIKTNCLFYKLKSLFSLLVANEISTVFKDQAILKDLLKREDQNRTDMLTNTNLISGNIDFLVISISKDRGRILQKSNEKLSRFFDYSVQDFQQISYIKQLIPPFISVIHNDLIENMLTRGYSSSVASVITTFGQSKYGFIFPMNIYLNHVYGYADDFSMHGTLLKVETQNQFLLFDNSGQILGLTFDLFMRMMDEDDHDEDQEYYINKMEQSQKTQLQQRIKSFIEKTNIQFIIPQISQLIKAFSSQVDTKMQKTSMKSHMLANGNHIRLKMPRRLQDLVSNFRRRNFNFSRSIKSYKSNVSIKTNQNENVNVDLLKNQNTQSYTDYISENRDFYLDDQCLNDYDLKIALHYNELVFGDEFSKRYNYFQITILEMTKIKEKSKNLHLNTLYPKTMCSTNQLNSNSFPDWVHNINQQQIISPNNNNILNIQETNKHTEGSNKGFPVNIFNKKQNTMNDQLLQSQKFENRLDQIVLDQSVSHQAEIELDRSHNADNSKLFLFDSDAKLQENLVGLSKPNNNNIFNIKSEKEEFSHQLSMTNRNKANSQNQMIIAESERPFQQKPSNDPYLNPKQQILTNNDIDDIISPTQQSVLDMNNQFQSNLHDNTLRDHYQNQIPDSTTSQKQPFVHQFSLANNNSNLNNYVEQSKEREETQPNYQDQDNTNSAKFYNNNNNPGFMYSTTIHEVKKSIWEKRGQNENGDEIDQQHQENQDEQKMNVDDDIFGVKDLADAKQQNQEEKQMHQVDSYKSESQSEQIDKRYLAQRQYTNSKQSTKSKIQTKDNNKNSVASSQQSIRFDNDIIKDMINTKRMPQAFSKFIILSQLFPLVLIIMSSIFVIMTVNNYQNSMTELDSISNIQFLGTSYARSAMSQLGQQIIHAPSFATPDFALLFEGFYQNELKNASAIFQQQMKDYSDVINKKEETIIMGDSNEYLGYQFTDQIKTEAQISYPDFIELSYNAITQYINQPPLSNVEINAFQFLTFNFNLNVNLHQQLLIQSYSQLNSNISVIEQLFITIFVIQLICTLLFLILQIPQIISIHKYQEKVFLLVTRIYDLESLKEITRLSMILDSLKSTFQIWMKVDFSKLGIKEIILNQDQKKQGKQIVLSSQIFDQRIKPWQSLLMILVIFLLSQVYFGSSVIVISSKQSIIKESFSVNQLCQQSNLAINSFIFSTEILVFESIVRDKSHNFKSIDRSQFLQLQKDAQLQMSEFTSNLKNTLEKFSIFDTSTLDKVDILIQKDICSVLTCTAEQKTQFTNGIIGLIQEYMSLVISQDKLTTNLIMPTNKNDLLTYLELTQHIKIMLLGFQIPLQSMEQLIEYFTTGNKNAIDSIILFIQVYIITAGVFIVLLALFVNRYLLKKFKSSIIQINFLLTFIPREKMTEDATIHMLKSLSNCY